MTERAPIGAAVDLGSNSVHLLVATIAGHRLEPIVDESAFLGLGAAVDTQSHLGVRAREALVTTLVGYAATARHHDATAITFIGTEPIRRAGDGWRIGSEIEAATGVPLHVLSHEEEAYLTLIGVTEGMPVDHETLVVDIGGGSSEFCAVAPGGIARAAGLRLGSNRLTSTFVGDDPATAEQVDAMRRAADEALGDALASEPAEVIVVGGTASNLLKVTAAGREDRVITHERLAEALATLTAAPAATTVERFGVNPTRARILPAGAAIVEALMRRYARRPDRGLRGRASRGRDPGGGPRRSGLARSTAGPGPRLAVLTGRRPRCTCRDVRPGTPGRP